MHLCFLLLKCSWIKAKRHISLYIFYNNYNEMRYLSPWGQQICFITTPRLLLLCLIWRQWLSSTRKNSDNAAVTFSTCDAWKLSPHSDHYHLWENHKGSLLWKSHISTKSLPFRKPTNILVHTSKPSSTRRRREQLMRNLILDERDRPWLFTRTRLSFWVGAFGLFRSSTVLWFLF